MTLYKVLTVCAIGAPEDCWAIDGELIRYPTIQSAKDAILEAVSDSLDEQASASDYVLSCNNTVTSDGDTTNSEAI